MASSPNPRPSAVRAVREGFVGLLGLLACVAALYAATMWALSHLRF